MSANRILDFDFYQQEDQPLFSILTKDIRVMRYITEKAETDLEANDNFKKILLYNTTHQDQTGYYKFFDQETYIGFGKLSWDEEGKLEIGYMIVPDHWSKGYATLIIATLLDMVPLNKATVYAIIDPNNGASKHLLEKHRFVSVWQGIEDGLPSEHLVWQP